MPPNRCVPSAWWYAWIRWETAFLSSATTRGEVLKARSGELAILAELLLRGPQTIGELRGRASRMSPMESLEAAQGLVSALMDRPEPLAKQIAPAAGSRAVRFVQLLCIDLHPVEYAAPRTEQPASSVNERLATLEKETQQLRIDLDDLRRQLAQIVNR